MKSHHNSAPFVGQLDDPGGGDERIAELKSKYCVRANLNRRAHSTAADAPFVAPRFMDRKDAAIPNAASQIPTAPAPEATVEAAVGIRNRTVLVYCMAAVAVIAPGALASLVQTWLPSSALAARLQGISTVLEDIRFGSGMRFWLGVAGAVTMGLLLLYPLRKALARSFRVGSVGAWFHAHILMGVIGPVLILYHCNFGLGALNANVALWTMLVVAISGVAGHFVHARISAGFYGDKLQARERLGALVAMLRSLEGAPAARAGLVERLEEFEARHSAPRRIVSTVTMPVRVAAESRQFHRDLAWTIGACSSDGRWTQNRRSDCDRHAQDLLARYLLTVQSAARRALIERIWARWRMFHLPVFLVMIAAVVLHVGAVWDMDSRAPVDITTTSRASDLIAMLLDGGAAAPPSITQQPAERDTASPEAATAPSTTEADILARLQNRPVEVKADQVRLPIPMPTAPIAVARAMSDVAPMPPEARALPPLPIRPPSKSAAAPSPSPLAQGQAARMEATTPATDIEATYAALRQRAEQAPPMGLGAAHRGAPVGILTLAERMAQLKSQRFDHSTTRFLLTGKHTRADCADCHKTTFEGTPRDCVACHQTDDPHKGRRSDCARCHTTNRWTQILRR